MDKNVQNLVIEFLVEWDEGLRWVHSGALDNFLTVYLMTRVTKVLEFLKRVQPTAPPSRLGLLQNQKSPFQFLVVI